MQETHQPEKLFEDFSSASKADWLDRISKDLKGGSPDSLLWKTREGLDLYPFQSPEDISASEKPLTGVFPQGDKDLGQEPRHWANITAITVEDLAAANKEALHALSNGSGGIHFDLSRQQPASLPALLKDIQPQYCTLSFTVASQPAQWLQAYRDFLSSNKQDIAKVQGSLAWEALSSDAQSYGLSAAEDVKTLIKLRAELPGLKVLHLDASRWHEEGANPLQELALSLAWLTEWTDALSTAGLSPKAIFDAFSIQMAIGPMYFPEIAKFRCLRLLLSSIAGAFGQEYAPADWSVAGITALRNKSTLDVENNILRNTSEAMSAITGGANSITCRPHDALSTKQEGFSKRIARNISTILREEAQLGKTADAVAGSYYINHLCEQIGSKSWEQFQEIEKAGGLLSQQAAITTMLQDEAAQREKRTEQGQLTLVGVNQYAAAKAPAAAKSGARLGTAFEQIRAQVAEATTQPAALLVKITNDAMGRARAAFSFDFLALGGISATECSLDTLPEEAPALLVLCGSDEQYAESGPGHLASLSKRYPQSRVILAGDPGDARSAMEAAGLSGSIHRKVNKKETLSELLSTCWNLKITF